MMFVFFFFSSRRRHTRCLSDWSSDVCSSDLVGNVHVADFDAPMEALAENVHSQRRAGSEIHLRGSGGNLVIGEQSSATDRKSTRLNSSHLGISYAVFCLKKKNRK